MEGIQIEWVESGAVFLAAPTSKKILSQSLKVGVLFSGGPASGGNDVLAGLYHTLQKIHPASELIGFLGGPFGLLENRTKKIELLDIEKHQKQGGFDLLGTGRTKLETKEDYKKALAAIEALKLDGLVFIGGDDTNTNAYHLAAYLEKANNSCSVVGVPKTIDGDLKNAYIETSFGFDTATRVYGELIGNICKDAISSLKYTHFIRLMGRTASHIALECALMTHPNLTYISEEVLNKKLTLKGVVEEVVELLEMRAKKGKNYAVILLPEGLIEAIFEIKVLLQELSRLEAKGQERKDLSKESLTLLESLPEDFQKMLLFERDPHGNVQVSKIETEKLLSLMVEKRLKETKSKAHFNPLHHFFGYEGRCATPSLFDTTYCYELGRVASLLIRDKRSSTMASIKGLAGPPSTWCMQGIPLRLLMGQEERKGKVQVVVKKSLVDLEGPVFQKFIRERENWKLEDGYLSPGPMQLSNFLITNTLKLENKNFSEIP